MNEKKMNEENDLEKFAKVAKDLSLSKLLPEFYQDSLQPAAKEVGKGLETVAKTINVALSPVTGLIWGFDKLEAFVKKRMEEKFSNNKENIVPPPPNIAVPLLESLRYTAFQEELREMYINLLAVSMDKERTETAHPSFVEVIKQLSSQEAKLLLHLSELDNFPNICDTFRTIRGSGQIPSFDKIESNQIKSSFENITSAFKDNLNLELAFDNYVRLRLVDIDSKTAYKLNDSPFLGFNEQSSSEKIELEISYSEFLFFTPYGVNFVNTCMRTKT